MKGLIFLWFLSQVVWAGNGVGGGHAVVCNEASGKKTVRLLDYYEAEVLLPGLKLNLPQPSNVGEALETLIRPLDSLDRKRADAYREAAKNFWNDGQFVKGAVLKEINDHGYIPLYPHCTIQQLAMQKMPSFPEEKKFFIQQELWENLSIADRAGLILHEIIYWEARAAGHKDSVNSRRLNIFLASKKIQEVSIQDYRKQLEILGFNVDDAAQFVVWLMNPVRLPASVVEKPFCASLVPYVKASAEAVLSFSLISGPNWVSLSSNGEVCGTPTKANLGWNEFVVRVTGPQGLHDQTTVAINITDLLLPSPKWKSPLIELGTQVHDRVWVLDLHAFVTSDPSDKVSFKAQGLPPWMQFNPVTGILLGTPAKKDVGNYSINGLTVVGKNGLSTAQAVGAVIPSIEKPQWISNPISFTTKEDAKFEADLSHFVANPDMLPLKFELLACPNWLSLSSMTGTLFGTPTKLNVGANKCTVKISWQAGGQTYFAETNLIILVTHVNHPPYWVLNPIVLPTAYVGVMMEPLSFAMYAMDVDGDALKFDVLNLPTWLQMKDGKFYGRPTKADIGNYTFEIRVRDSVGATSMTKVQVKVAQ